MNMQSANNDILIIPDIHGRIFWKEATKNQTFQHTVFLGDYLDPYTYEGINNDEALENFKEIINYKLQHDSTTTLLIGNHDMHYISDEYAYLARSSRYSKKYAKTYSRLFNDHINLFQLAYTAKLNDTDCLLTHAGISKTWLNLYTHLSEHFTAADLNQLIYSEEGIEALARIGGIRGGWDQAGSILWADLHEIDDNKPLYGWYQIFGHSQQPNGPVVTKHFACLDCRRAFTLSEVLSMKH